MMSVAQPVESSQYAQDYEDYRKACREKYLQASMKEEVHEQEEKETTKIAEKEVDSIQDAAVVPETDAISPEISSSTGISSSTEISSSTGISSPTEVSSPVAPIPNVESIRKSGSLERRNSLGKMVSAVSNIFAKKSSSPTIKKKLTKEEKEKKEQDWRMARLIAEMEFEGRSDEDIQMHLFHIRDQSQFGRPRSNSVGDWFKSMHQAFKDEFSLRREPQVATVHVSTVNPFYAAPSANYMQDVAYTYEDLVALENVPRGVKSLDHLPVLTYEGQELPSAQTTCAVCMMEFEKSEELRSLHCTHHFHKDCIDKWLSVGSTCPVCKSDVASDAL